jgi:SAM-dependent methyltransferase
VLAKRALRHVEARFEFRRAAIERRQLADYQGAVERALDDQEAGAAFTARGFLPGGWGQGRPERLVEFPWLVARLRERPVGLTLDAGSTLNHPYILDRVLPLVDALHVVTLAPEEQSFPERGVSYLYVDLRALPLRSATYDTVVCVSTLEHVGMDVSGWHAAVPPAADPQLAALSAARELRRVVKPQGRILLTLPFGRPDNLGWVRQFDQAALRDLMAAFEPSIVRTTIYSHGEDGWQLSSEEAAAGSQSQAYWASAVACAEIQPTGMPAQSGLCSSNPLGGG